MDSFEYNKIAGGVLFALLVLFGVQNIGEVLYHTEHLEEPAYAVPGIVEEHAGAAEKPAGPSFEVALANADPSQGAKLVNKCDTCHTRTEGGANKIGPNLYGILGRPVASHAGFAYSDAMKKLGGNWDFQKLEQFIANPRKVAPGTKMSFPGMPDVEDRAALVAYLNTLSANPLPLPKPTETAPPAAPAGAQAGPAPEGGGSVAPMVPKAENPESVNKIIVPAPETPSGEVGTNVERPAGASGSGGSQEQQQRERGSTPLEEAIPAPASKNPGTPSPDKSNVEPEEQRESQPVH